MILEGHLRRAQVAFGDFGQNPQYRASNVCAGRWPGVLVQETDAPGEGEIIGFVALNEDPYTSGIKVYDLAILLMREDEHTPDMNMASNGKMGYHRTDKVPLMMCCLPNGNISLNRGDKRYLTGLALQKLPGVDDLAVFTRVGLCQLYREFWMDELGNRGGKRMFNLMVV